MKALAELDWNLLKCLDALLQEGNVTRAAQRANMTQPAMSRALGRLRSVFEDELFVRASGGMAPTQRAIELAPMVNILSRQVGDVLSGTSPFDPLRSRRSFTLLTTDLVEVLLLPQLSRQLGESAPGIELNIRRVAGDWRHELDRGEAALALVPGHRSSGELMAQVLFKESFCCIARQGHPGVGKRLGLQRFCELSHLLIAPRGKPGGFVDSELHRRGLARHVALSVSSFMVAPEIIAQSDLIATVPTRIAKWAAPNLKLNRFKPPIALPGFSMQQLWHPRSTSDPAHQFLRRLIRQILVSRQSGDGSRGENGDKGPTSEASRLRLTLKN